MEVKKVLGQEKTNLVPVKLNAVKALCIPCQKASIMWRSFKFCNKIFLAGSLLYYTSRNGAWGTQEESLEFANKFWSHVQILSPVYIAALIFPDE